MNSNFGARRNALLLLGEFATTPIYHLQFAIGNERNYQ